MGGSSAPQAPRQFSLEFSQDIGTGKPKAFSGASRFQVVGSSDRTVQVFARSIPFGTPVPSAGTHHVVSWRLAFRPADVFQAKLRHFPFGLRTQRSCARGIRSGAFFGASSEPV